jgi:hypothetical protein
MKTKYEWDIETVDEHGDVIDHHHADTILGLRIGDLDLLDGEKRLLVLVRDEWDDREGLTSRGWAYVENGELPKRFDDGQIETFLVPQRFRDELSQWIENCKWEGIAD